MMNNVINTLNYFTINVCVLYLVCFFCLTFQNTVQYYYNGKYNSIVFLAINVIEKLCQVTLSLCQTRKLGIHCYIFFNNCY